ncbi:hypothetical protein [Streptomyces sp. DSM 118878]
MGAAVAGVIIGVVQVWPDPPFTLKDWAKEANTTCAQTMGEVDDVARDANDAVAALDAGYAEGTAMPEDFVYVGNLLYKMAGLQNRQAGDLGGIRSPSSKSGETGSIVDDMRAANRTLYQAAEKLRHVNVEDPQETVDSFGVLVDSYNQKNDGNNRSLKSMGAHHCLSTADTL